MPQQKRERSVNFTQEETDILNKLVEEYKDIIENKKSGAATWSEKESCWKEIEACFNSMSHSTYRTSKTLKIKYEGMKRLSRKLKASYHTEGDPSAASPQTAGVYVKPMITMSVDEVKSNDESDQSESEDNSESRVDYPKDMDLNIGNVKNEVITQYDVHIDTPHSSNEMSTLNGNQFTPATQLNVEENTEPDKRWSNWRSKVFKSKKFPVSCKAKQKTPFERLAESKLEIIKLQKLILREEQENNRKKWAFEEEEREHKRRMWELERKLLLEKVKQEM